MTLLAWVTGVLQERGVSYALIGAAALAVHGVTRATGDLDLLTVDPRCLDRAWWTVRPSRPASVAVDVRVGDVADPLAGVVRCTAAGKTSLDLIVGRPGWQGDVVRRARPTPLAGATVPVAGAADLVLLKLYAGGPQDAWDVVQLLDAVPTIETEVEGSLGPLPPESVALWRRILRDRA